MQIRLLKPKMCQNKYLAIPILFIVLKLCNIKFNIKQKSNPSDLCLWSYIICSSG